MKTITLLLSFLLTVSISFSQPIYHKVLKSTVSSGMLYRCLQASDGGYVSIGVLTNFENFNDDFLIGKFNGMGNSEWVKAVSSLDADEFTDVTQTSDGGFVAVGTSLNFDNFMQQGVIVKLDADGNKVWSKNLSLGTGSCTAKKIQKDNSGNLYILGTLEVGGPYTDYYIMKLNSGGSILNQTIFGSEYSDFALSFLRLYNGDFVIGGWGNNGSGESIHLIKVNADLTVAWNSYMAGTIKLFAYDMKQKSNGNLVLAGRYDNGIDPYSILIMEVNNDTGNPEWAKYYPLSGNLGCFAYGLAIQANDRIAVTGLIEDANASTFALEVNETGTPNWAKKINSVNEQSAYGYGICKASDFGYLVCGLRLGIDSSIVQIVKLNLSGAASCIATDLVFATEDFTLVPVNKDITVSTATLSASNAVFGMVDLGHFEDACQPLSTKEEPLAQSFSVFPNPFSGKLYISSPESGSGKYRIFNATGMNIREGILSGNLTEIQLEAEPGIYFLQVSSGNKWFTQKVIVQ